MNRKLLVLSCAALTWLTGCGPHGGGIVPPSQSAAADLRILAGSEMKTLEPILTRFGQQNGVSVSVSYLGSVDIMTRLQTNKVEEDAVWPANSIWLSMGDTHRVVKDEQSILWTPVVLGVKRSRAQELGWIGRHDVKVADILRAAEQGRLRFMMTSATQSNSGACAYLGFLYAFAGKPGVLTMEHIEDKKVQSQVRALLGKVNRSAGSSGWLKDLFLKKYDAYDAMFNYEAMVVEANQELARSGQEPLYVVYPSDGLAISDAPLGFVDHGDPKRADTFKKLKAYLLSAPVQKEIADLGRRIGPVGESAASANPAVMNPDWGILTAGLPAQIRYPKADVIRAALAMYQESVRKPSFTVYCLDFSGSMQGQREEGLKTAMRLILDQTAARTNMLQASSRDISVVIPFDASLRSTWTAKGNNQQELMQLWSRINSETPSGGTDIYSPVIHAFEMIEQTPGIENYFPAVILLTDGESNRGATLDDLRRSMGALRIGRQVPVFAIRFGEASQDQLQQICDATSGRIFDGTGDLATAFRQAKGEN